MNLIALDHQLFHAINAEWTNGVFDVVFPFITDLQKNVPVVCLAVLLFLISLCAIYRWKGLRILLACLVALGVTDFINYHMLKQNVHRPRPEFAGMNPVLRTHSHSGTSFPSNHAANITAVAIFLGYWFRRARYFFYLYAFLICYSRVYVGVHFPIDVIGGAGVGWTIAQFVQYLYLRLEWKFANRTESLDGA